MLAPPVLKLSARTGRSPPGGIDAAEGAQQQLAPALLDRAARHLDVLGGHGIAYLGDRLAVGVQLLDVATTT